MDDAQSLLLLPLAALQPVERNFLRVEHRDARGCRVFLEHGNVENRVVLRPQRDLAQAERHRLMGCRRTRRTRRRYHHHRSLARALANLRHPYIRRGIFGKRNRNRRGRLLGFYKAKSEPFERRAQTILNNFALPLAEGRAVLNREGDCAGPGHRNNLARQLLLGPAPVCRRAAAIASTNTTKESCIAKRRLSAVREMRFTEFGMAFGMPKL